MESLNLVRILRAQTIALFHHINVLVASVTPFFPIKHRGRKDQSQHFLCLISQYDTDSLPWEQQPETWCESGFPIFRHPLSIHSDLTALILQGIGMILRRITAAAHLIVHRKVNETRAPGRVKDLNTPSTRSNPHNPKTFDFLFSQQISAGFEESHLLLQKKNSKTVLSECKKENPRPSLQFYAYFFKKKIRNWPSFSSVFKRVFNKISPSPRNNTQTCKPLLR